MYKAASKILLGWLYSAFNFSIMKQPKLLLVVIALFVYSCGPAEKEESLVDKADRLAHEFIIADGHVDLPYRMVGAGFMKRGQVLDVSIAAPNGNFDLPRAKKGGLDAPFMSIYIPADYQVIEGYAKKFADSLISMTKQLAATYPTVRKWIKRFEAEGLRGLLDRKRSSGRPREIPEFVRDEIVRLTLETRPVQLDNKCC